MLNKGLSVKLSALLQAPCVKILLFLHEKGEVRYTDLTNLIASRGTLSLNLKELDAENLIQRRVVTTKPIQAHYSLTDKGTKIAKQLTNIINTL
jgi:DNA-binding HxlR family transcriptional regulator